MKWKIAITAFALGSFLGACTTAPSRPVVEEQQLSNIEKYRRAVQSGAERRGVQVYWVHPPAEEDLAPRPEKESEDDEG